MGNTTERRLVRLAPGLEADFFRLHCDANGHGWCACVAWHVPTWDGWGERTAAENRALREALFARGEHDGYLAYVGVAAGEEPRSEPRRATPSGDASSFPPCASAPRSAPLAATVGGAPAAWCQAGPRDRLPKLVAQLGLAPDPGAWAVSCFFVAPAHRGRGLAAWLLGAVLDDLRARGVARVEAYPRRARQGEALDAGEVWTGPEAMLRAAGFVEAEGGDARRGVLVRRLT